MLVTCKTGPKTLQTAYLYAFKHKNLGVYTLCRQRVYLPLFQTAYVYNTYIYVYTHNAYKYAYALAQPYISVPTE
jgi:hypothetical protein